MWRALFLLHWESTRKICKSCALIILNFFALCISKTISDICSTGNGKAKFGILSELVVERWLILEARIDSFVGFQSGNENVKYP